MAKLSRPWSNYKKDEVPFTVNDCLVSEERGNVKSDQKGVIILSGAIAGEKCKIILHPYPKKENGVNPDRVSFPIRPKNVKDAQVDPSQSDIKDVLSFNTLVRMNQTLARVQELSSSLEDPENVWERLRIAWNRAKDEEDPLMAEIVKQANNLSDTIRLLSKKIRKVLRRKRELTPLDRAQEMDRQSMIWFSRQPGRNTPERAGSKQRVLSIVREENFDTLENRVFRSYLELAVKISKEWLLQHKNFSKSNEKFQLVSSYSKQCQILAQFLIERGVSKTASNISPNYVLMQDKYYKSIYDAWILLLNREKALDDLWAWQAQTWTDFCVLSIILALDEMEESELIAQSPIIWRTEAYTGRWFEQERPIAVFWLRETGRIVEVQSRPEAPGQQLLASRAHVALKINDPKMSEDHPPRRVSVWTPHSFSELDLNSSADECLSRLKEVQRLRAPDVLHNGLVLIPAIHKAGSVTKRDGKISVNAIGIGPSGKFLAQGISALQKFIEGDIYKGS